MAIHIHFIAKIYYIKHGGDSKGASGIKVEEWWIITFVLDCNSCPYTVVKRRKNAISKKKIHVQVI